MATKKKTAKKTKVKKRARRQASSKHGLAVADPKTQRRPAAKTTTAKESKPRARPATKSKRARVDLALVTLEQMLHGMGAERADRIRQCVRSILSSFR